MKLSVIQVWYLLGVVSVISATDYEFTVETPDTIIPLGGGALSSNPTNGLIFLRTRERTWWNQLNAKLGEMRYTLRSDWEPCGRYSVDGCELNLVRVQATPRDFFIKDEGESSADGKHGYKLYFPSTIVERMVRHYE